MMKKTLTLTTPQALGVLALMLALVAGFALFASTWSTHTLALTAVVLLVFRIGPSK